MNYSLADKPKKKIKTLAALASLFALLRSDKKRLMSAGIAGLINSLLTLVAPIFIAHIVDTFIRGNDFHGVIVFSAYLLALFIGAIITNYTQTMLMGRVGQNLLYVLRNEIFAKLQALPVAFFNKNKAGDLISRINNDTDKLNQFFSRSLVQFVSGIISIVGAAIFVTVLNWRLGLALITPAVTVLLITLILSNWIKRKNAVSLKRTGGMSAGIQESLENFKVVVAFNRRDYFREKFAEVNDANYKAAVGAGIANNTLTPLFGFASSVAQLIVVAYGLVLVTHGLFTFGSIISFLSYVTLLYTPLRQMAVVWADFQTALAAWDRIADILSLETNLPILQEKNNTEEHAHENTSQKKNAGILSFNNMSFGYSEKMVLSNVSINLDRGKTYALVGPTGGGKTTMASLMARLYDPTSGEILLDGRDIRTYEPADRVKKIGFILQEPFMFSGTIRDNIVYGNDAYKHMSVSELEAEIKNAGLETLLTNFDAGLETNVSTSGGTLSLGQKQLIAFMRVVLRNPELLILDEATANIDTVTEQLLEEILKKLPTSTTKVIIAHRLNTIENADEIFFINGGAVTPAGDLNHAVEMLLHGNRNS